VPPFPRLLVFPYFYPFKLEVLLTLTHAALGCGMTHAAGDCTAGASANTHAARLALSSLAQLTIATADICDPCPLVQGFQKLNHLWPRLVPDAHQIRRTPKHTPVMCV
jgi:hypothetical protein